MIPALSIPAPTVAIRFHPAGDASFGTPDLPVIAGRRARREERRWPESTSGQRIDLSGLRWSEESPTAARHEALLRKLVVEEAERMNIELRSGEVACQIQLFRDQFRIDSAAAMQAWLDQAGLTFERLASFFRAELLMAKVEEFHSALIERELETQRALLSACAGLRRPSPTREGDELIALMGKDAAGNLLRRRILLRVLAERELSRRGQPVLEDEIEDTSDRFRECFGLFESVEMRSWLTFSGLSQEAFTRQMRDFSAVIKLDLLSADALEDRRAVCDAVKTVATWSSRAARSR